VPQPRAEKISRQEKQVYKEIIKEEKVVVKKAAPKVEEVVKIES